MSGGFWPGMAMAVLASAAAAAPTTGGCDGPAEEPPPMPLDFESLRQYPRDMGEIDLGEFSVARRIPSGHQLFVKFHLHLLVERPKVAKIEASLEHQKQRVRDQVLQIATELDLESFHEPTLRALKSELLRHLQRAVASPSVHEIVFSDYSTEIR